MTKIQHFEDKVYSIITILLPEAFFTVKRNDYLTIAPHGKISNTSFWMESY